MKKEETLHIQTFPSDMMTTEAHVGFKKGRKLYDFFYQVKEVTKASWLLNLLPVTYKGIKVSRLH